MFVDLFPNSLTPEFCKDAIERFEAQPEHHIEGMVGYADKPNIINHSIKKCKELNLSLLPDWEDVDEVFAASVKKNVLALRDKYDGLKRISVFDTGYRIKRYLPDEEEWFDWHIEVNGYSQGNRYMVFLWYLNTVAEGGETEFKEQPVLQKPEQGLMVAFPTIWTHLHRGLRPISEAKYIAVTWLTYEPEKWRGY